jgi:sensor histidine kinase YesM
MTMNAVVLVSLFMIVPLGLVGSVLHFLFDWTRHNRFVAIFSAVNESYWEHIKIAIWPVLMLQVVLFSLGGYQYPSFIPAATIALYSIPVSMVGLVFVYKWFTKRNILWIDISIFFVCIAIAQSIFVLVLEQLAATSETVVISGLFLAGLVVAFLLFTFRPPKEPDVFLDPINKHYGLLAHPDLDSRSSDRR